MKIDKITKRIKEIDEQALNTVDEALQQIANLKEELTTITDSIEDNYRSGDIVKGQQLAEQKVIIESKIGFLETFLTKRKNIPLMADDEAKKLRTELNNELYNSFYDKKRKTDSLFKELETIQAELEKEIMEVQNIGNDIIRLTKVKEPFYQIDQRINILNIDLRQFVLQYKNYLNMVFDKK